MGFKLTDYQLDAVHRMKNGCILCGGVGSGKSLTSLGYYYLRQGGSESFLKGGKYVKMKRPKDLYIITTARKRDTLEWEKEFAHYLISPFLPEEERLYSHKVVVDSWNNIEKYVNIKNAFFIFDEQRVVGYGPWSKAFINISKSNEWILLSATPGDKWEDYIPVFIANGFYRNKKEFENAHIVYCYRLKFPKVDRYLNTGRLIRLRNRILVDMDFDRKTVSHHEDVITKYDIFKYRMAGKDRWNPYTNKPIKTASELCQVWRRIVNEDESKQIALLKIFEDHPKMIVFYNFDYELDILKLIFDECGTEMAEWNGHKHQPIPDTASWVYFVQYNAGAEGWNCITTDTIVFYSENYSYRIMQQAAGRIDRMNTPYTELYYYHLKSKSNIDLAISRALREKKNFNEGRYMQKAVPEMYEPKRKAA